MTGGRGERQTLIMMEIKKAGGRERGRKEGREKRRRIVIVERKSEGKK